MRKKRVLFAFIIMLLLFGGCKNSTEKVIVEKKDITEETREVINVPYVESMFGGDVKSSEIEDIIKDNKGKFVRWTANLKEVGNRKLVIQLEGLTRVEASFNYNVNDDKQLKEGDIITISGSLKKYFPSLFDIPPIWELSDCKLENTTEEEKQLVIEYNKKIEGEMANKKEEQKVAEAKAQEEANKVISTDYKTFQQNYTKLTQVQRNDYFQNVNGRMVQWTGTVEEVSSDFIYVRCLNMYNYDYAAYFSSEYGEILKSINKGDKITIKGRISDELDGKGWQLNECSIIK